MSLLCRRLSSSSSIRSIGHVVVGRRCLGYRGRQQQQFAASFSTTTATADDQKIPVKIVDLRTAGWSLLERLCLEEFLQQQQHTNWLILGTHEATQHRHLKMTKSAPDYIRKSILETHDTMGDGTYNSACAVILDDNSNNKDLNVAAMKRHGILCLQGPPTAFLGSSVVVDHASILTTWISNATNDTATVEFLTDQLWAPTLQRLDSRYRTTQSSSDDDPLLSPLTMVMDTKSCSKGDNSGRMFRLEDLGVQREAEESTSTIPALEEGPLSLVFQPPNRYCLGSVPVGLAMADPNNHTVRSLLYWDYHDEDHESYYSSSSSSFAKLQDVFLSSSTSTPNLILNEMVAAMQEEDQSLFSVDQILTPRDTQTLMAQQNTSLQDWWNKHSQWSIVQQLV
ncbi:expressed unknown protein [Seminavis robusta]|uniref:Uncharacterized protein n=1 Tax=Seminavis robusta TaxID=568900 RepID=A0A9N8HHP3_9STRA|nr:expressed unknown protein [Seminavis robusta]|eukprot:Sro720_g192570.1 n/a (396) ;mRNA; f:18634-19821